MDYDPRDVQFTLYKCYEELMDQYNKSKNENRNSMSMSKTKAKFTESTMKRLYSSKTESKPEIRDISFYVDRLVKIYYNLNKKYTNDDRLLYQCWEALSPQDKANNYLIQNTYSVNITDSDTVFQGKLEQFLSIDNLYLRISEMFKKVCGYESKNPRPLHDYWANIPAEERYLKGLFKYSSNDLYEIFQKRFIDDAKKREEKLIIEEKQHLLKEKEKNDKNKIKSIQEKEKIDKKMEHLAKPKDKWKTGKVMLKIQKDCKYDNILNKMIKAEFQDNKVFK